MTKPLALKVFLEIEGEAYQLLRGKEEGLLLRRQARPGEVRPVSYLLLPHARPVDKVISEEALEILEEHSLFSCNCEGYQHRRACRHVQCVERLLFALVTDLDKGYKQGTIYPTEEK